MAINHNTGIAERLRNLFKIQQNVESVPEKVADAILPVVDVSPTKVMRFIQGIAVDATAVVVHTCSTTKQTWFVGGYLSVAKDVVSTSLASSLKITPKGGGSNAFIRIRTEPITASQLTQSVILPHPILLEKGSVILVENTTAVASIDTAAIIYFYETDGEE